MILNLSIGRPHCSGPARVAGGILVAGALTCTLFAPAAGADVTLSTRVEKVESILDASGNVQRRLVSAQGVLPGEELRYTITVSNDSEMLVSEGRVVVTNPIPDGTAYVPGTAGGADCLIEVSADGETFVEEGAGLSLNVAEGSIPAEGSLSAEGSLPAEGSLSAEGSLPAEGSLSAEGSLPAEGSLSAEGSIPGEAAGAAAAAKVSELRWTLERDLEPGASHDVFFHVRMEAGGAP